jgi:hypothetical protein
VKSIGRVLLAAGLLAVLTAAPAAAAGPDRYVESGTESGIHDHWTDVCGATIEFTGTWRATYLTWGARWEVQWQALRTIVGPGGTLLIRNNYSFGGPMGSVVEDPVAGTVTERGESTTTGARVFLSPASGVVFRETGLLYERITAVSGPGDEFTLTVEETFSHGQHDPLSEDAFDALVCGVLVGA